MSACKKFWSCNTQALATFRSDLVKTCVWELVNFYDNVLLVFPASFGWLSLLSVPVFWKEKQSRYCTRCNISTCIVVYTCNFTPAGLFWWVKFQPLGGFSPLQWLYVTRKVSFMYNKTFNVRMWNLPWPLKNNNLCLLNIYM